MFGWWVGFPFDAPRIPPALIRAAVQGLGTSGWVMGLGLYERDGDGVLCLTPLQH